MTLLALASPVPGAMGAWLDARLASGLVLALPLGLGGLALLRFGLLARLGNSVLEPRESSARSVATGFAAAAVLLAAALLLPALLGAFQPGAAGYAPFSPTPDAASLASAPASFGFFALQSLVEELLFRAFFLTLLAASFLFLARLFFGRLSGMSEPLRGRAAARRWLVSGLLANAGQALAFASMHAVNPNVTPLALLNIGLAGAVLGWLFWSTGGLLGPWTFHALWNFTLAALALPVSGMTMGRPVLPTGIRGAGLAALSGGAFGPEGSVLSTVTLAALLVLLVRRSAGKLPGGYPSSP
ncbi:MAG TPA: CPBP family intramembrane glutamic endopeptidase [Thermoanaerobaculia bacterium]|nr:CPBP family intramembrane glutamic endopeptidase [Thermoanaerobaculia bacterium]